LGATTSVAKLFYRLQIQTLAKLGLSY